MKAIIIYVLGISTALVGYYYLMIYQKDSRSKVQRLLLSFWQTVRQALYLIAAATFVLIAVGRWMKSEEIFNSGAFISLFIAGVCYAMFRLQNTKK